MSRQIELIPLNLVPSRGEPPPICASDDEVGEYVRCRINLACLSKDSSCEQISKITIRTSRKKRRREADERSRGTCFLYHTS